MKLYHFMLKQYAIENLQKSRLKIATLNCMNDPYEFYLSLDGATEERKKQIKNHFDNVMGFLCFTKKLGDPLQWAHYAGNHSGICFEFNIPSSYLNKIKYMKSPRHISACSPRWEDELIEATKSKFKGWRYEREYRLAINLKEEGVVKEDKLFFMPFTKGVLVPTKAYLGMRCELTSEEEKVFVDNGIDVIKMTQHAKTYSIIPELS
ncbi:DUF2971 domain-containing protein [Photobacterium satsumensis]|uniref:DUF2971 domain-containing protein n=1 Tax=Photobacterium satsumensis TaxID=2910239 RepID=UPI003D0E8935